MNTCTDIAIMNEVVREEIRKQQAKRRAETERACAVEASRNRLLARRLTALNKVINRRPNLFKRLWAPVARAWELSWGVWHCAPEIFLNWCVTKGWLEKVEA